MGYSKDALKGISWLGGLRISTRGLAFIKLAIIARILTPVQFGISGIALIVLEMVEVLTETGINVLLIQEKEDIHNYIDTAWIVSIIRGIIITAVIVILTPFIAAFYNTSESLQFLYLVSIVPLLRGFINPSVAKFLKNLQYKNECIYRYSILFTETVVTVVVVLITRSPIGIIWGLLAGAIIEVILSFIISKPLPKLSFNPKSFKNIFHRGKWLTAAGIFNYFYHNADNLVVGKLLGLTSLGLYMQIYRISILPITEISDVFSRATFPIYVKMSEDLYRLKKAFIKTFFTIAIIVFPISFIIFFFPEQIILIILGKNWVVAAPVLKALALFGALRAVSNTAVGLFYSIQRQDVITKLTLISLAAMLITIVPFINIWGLIGAAYAVFVGTFISIPFVGFYIYKLFNGLENKNRQKI